MTLASAAGYGFGAAALLARVGHGGDFRFATGENVVGRDPDVEVRLDASTVSRRHARLVVTAEGRDARGLRQQERHVSRRRTRQRAGPLADGDAIRIGSVLVTFHVRASVGLDRDAGEVRS